MAYFVVFFFFFLMDNLTEIKNFNTKFFLGVVEKTSMYLGF